MNPKKPKPTEKPKVTITLTTPVKVVIPYEYLTKVLTVMKHAGYTWVGTTKLIDISTNSYMGFSPESNRFCDFECSDLFGLCTWKEIDIEAFLKLVKIQK